MKHVYGLFPEKLATLFVVVLVFSLAFPLLKEGLPSGHDIYAHTTYAKIFIHELEQGQFPVRWMQWIKPGVEQPLFNFYQVGFYYLVSFINLLSSSFLLSVKIAIILLWWSSAFFIFLLAKENGFVNGLLASIVYAFSPYLVLDVFIRASFPEFMAISLMPPIFWLIQKIFDDSSFLHVCLLSFFLGLGIISHLPAVLIFFPVLVGFVVFKFLEKKDIRKLGLVFVGGVWGFGFSAFYFLPALLELDLINIEVLTQRGFDFHKNFLDASQLISFVWGYGDQVIHFGNINPFVLGAISWSVILFTLLSTLILRKFEKEKIFWIAVIFYALFFMSVVSVFVWENLSFLEYVQFPWRFFMVIPLATAMLSSFLVNAFNDIRFRASTLYVVLFLTTIVFLPFLQKSNFVDLNYFNLDYSEWRVNPEAIKQAYLEPGYFPKGDDKSYKDTAIRSVANKISLFSLAILAHSLLQSLHLGLTFRKYFPLRHHP